MVLQSLERDQIECAVYLQFLTTNNQVEYEALLTGRDLAKVMKATSVIIRSDFQVIIGHVNEDYETKVNK